MIGFVYEGGGDNPKVSDLGDRGVIGHNGLNLVATDGGSCRRLVSVMFRKGGKEPVVARTEERNLQLDAIVEQRAVKRESLVLSAFTADVQTIQSVL